MSALPTGTVTFLVSGLESGPGSKEANREALRDDADRYRRVMRGAADRYQGYAFSVEENGFTAAFSSPLDAVLAAVDAHRTLLEEWGDGAFRVAIAIHSGVAEERSGSYSGAAADHAAGLLAVARGGQAVASPAVYELTHRLLPEGVDLEDLGEHRLGDLSISERVFRLTDLRVAGEPPGEEMVDVASPIGAEVWSADDGVALADRRALDQIELGDRVVSELAGLAEQREVRIAGIRVRGRRRRPSGEKAPIPRELRTSGWLWVTAAVTVALTWWSIFEWPDTREWWFHRDHTILFWLEDLRSTTVTPFMKALHALGSDWTVRSLRWATLIALVGFRRWRHLIVGLGALLVVEVVGTTMSLEIGRPRPVLDIDGSWQGYSHPSLPIAALTITLIVIGYSLIPKGRWRLAWFIASGVAVNLLSVARLYLGVDHPTDAFFGQLLGGAVGVVAFRFFVPDSVFPVSYRGGRIAHLDVDGARGEAIGRAVKDQLGIEVLAVEQHALEASAGSTPLRMRVAEGPRPHLFAKLYAQNHLRSDRWYKLGRTILYGSLEDEVQFSTVRRLVEYEDYLLRVFQNGGLPSPEPYGFVEITPEREYLIVTEFLEGATDMGEAEVSDDIIDDALGIVRGLWDAGLAHRDLKPANLLVSDGKIALVDVAFATIRPSSWRQAVDLANMMLILGLRADPERVYLRAMAYFAPEDVAEAFAATRGVTMPQELRSAIHDLERQTGVDLVTTFRDLAPPSEPIAIQRWSLRRIALASSTLAGVLFFAGLLWQNVRGGGFL